MKPPPFLTNPVRDGHTTVLEAKLTQRMGRTHHLRTCEREAVGAGGYEEG